MEQERIAILGAGSWGSALAYLIGGKGYHVALWDRDSELIEAIKAQGRNPKYLPNTPLGETVFPTASMKEAVHDAQWVIVAVASDGVRAVVSDAAEFLHPRASVLSACKGLEADTGFTTSEQISTLLSDIPYAGLAVLSGPNLAVELSRGVPTATVVASYDPQIARGAQEMLMTERSFRVYTNTDVKGVELGGALKNVLAIGGGISDGLGFGDNTKAALMSRGLIEMTQLGVATGGKALTFLGLSGVGDLMATAGSRLSRNYRVGLGLAQRKSVEEILGELHQSAEGIATARAAQVLSRRYQVQTPVFAAINSVLHEGVSAAVAVEELMTRAARDEFAN
ncbi:MAG: NAD(P)H-dependent glycerol-3-phosphate dehydrogenase [Capsulimonas sp.]|uniref:NAD(P)H-dependent glycerol-3-phosphate dehydrogenase n=1 Tax=Capsulimonas sp. TaxID=2494211 RepID=UPI003265F2CD